MKIRTKRSESHSRVAGSPPRGAEPRPPVARAHPRLAGTLAGLLAALALMAGCARTPAAAGAQAHAAGIAREAPSTLAAGTVGNVGEAGAAADPGNAGAQAPHSPTFPSAQPTEPPVRRAGYVGVVLARQAVTVAAEADGRLASVAVRVGDTVRRGQELAALATDALHDERTVVQATVAAARGEQRRAELELDRTRDRRARRELHPELYSEEDLASARNAEQEAAAAVDSANAHVAEETGRLRQLETRLLHTVLRAPIDGRVALRYLDAGALVHSGEAVVRLISAGQYMLRFAVPPEQAAAIHKGARVEVRLDSQPLSLTGHVSQVAPRIDTASQMVFIEADLQVPPALVDRLQDGLPGRVTLST